MTALTCQAAVHAASDQLAGLLSDAERGPLEAHLADCDSCSCLMGQLRTTLAVMRSRGEVLASQVPRLYALANAVDADAADDLVQETLTSALADPDVDTTGSGLAAALSRLAAERGPDFESPVAPTAGSDPDADEAELFYPDFYTDGPDAGAWVDPPVAWGGARVLGPADGLVTTEAYGVVDAALAELDRIDAALVTLVDIEGVGFGRAALELGLPSGEARRRLARARFTVRAALDQYLRA